MSRIASVFIALLVLFAVGTEVSAQKKESGFTLEQNYPNPFNPDTKIPFVLKEELFGTGRPVMVSVRVFNVLKQLVAVPTALKHARGDKVRVANLEYPSAGKYEAYWDGLDRSGRHVASGVYFIQLTVNGRSQVKKMFVTK